MRGGVETQMTIIRLPLHPRILLLGSSHLLPSGHETLRLPSPEHCPLRVGSVACLFLPCHTAMISCLAPCHLYPSPELCPLRIGASVALVPLTTVRRPPESVSAPHALGFPPRPRALPVKVWVGSRCMSRVHTPNVPKTSALWSMLLAICARLAGTSSSSMLSTFFCD